MGTRLTENNHTLSQISQVSANVQRLDAGDHAIIALTRILISTLGQDGCLCPIEQALWSVLDSQKTSYKKSLLPIVCGAKLRNGQSFQYPSFSSELKLPKISDEIVDTFTY